jgi:hypothetical protein
MQQENEWSDDEDHPWVGEFSMIKWARFGLTKT